MQNRRKGMQLISLWLLPHEVEEIKNKLKKQVKDEEDLRIIGDLIGIANARGDFN